MEKIFKEIIRKYVPNLLKTINSEIQEVQQILSTINMGEKRYQEILNQITYNKIYKMYRRNKDKDDIKSHLRDNASKKTTSCKYKKKKRT